jgi:uncharacterized membrane protein HdeD (DUF308 family)
MSARDEVRELKTVATALLVFGVLTLAVGVFLVADPEETLKVFTVIFGIFLLIDGVLALVAAVLGRVESRALLSVVGVVSAIAGLILIKKPFQSLTVLIVILGIWLVVAGVARFVYAFTAPEGRGLYLLIAAIDTIAGIVILSWPHPSLKTLAVIAGIVFIVRGLIYIWAGWRLRGIVKSDPGGTALAT